MYVTPAGRYPQRYDPAVPVGQLVEHPDNPRRGDVEAIGSSMAAHGFYGAVYAQKGSGRIVVGNHRYRVAVARGEETLPVIWVDVDDDTAGRIMLVDNTAAMAGGFDEERLAAMLAEYHSGTELGLVGTGYSIEDLHELLGDTEPEPGGGGGDVDQVPESAPARTARGDVWLLGPHRVMCGDCRDPDDVARALASATINLAITSPPYADRREYDETSGFRPIPPDEYVDWFEAVQAGVAAHLAEDGSWFVNIKAGGEDLDTEIYVIDLVAAHVRRWGWHWLTEFCWERTGMPKQVVLRFKNQFEPIYQFTRSRPKIRPDAVRHASDASITAWGPGRGNTSWADPNSAVATQGSGGNPFEGYEVGPGLAYPGNRLPTFAGTHEATGHTAAFPVGLPEFFVKAYTDEGDVVFDPLLGSGSTIIAAHQQDRIGVGIEISPRYVDIVCRRWQEHTGVVPVLEATGEAHDFVGEETEA